MTNCPQTPVETLKVFAEVHYVCGKKNPKKFYFLQIFISEYRQIYRSLEMENIVKFKM